MAVPVIDHMKRIPIVPTVSLKGHAAHPGKASYSACRPLPASYMSEYSVLGLLIDDLAKALEVLRGMDLDVTEEAFGAEITVPGPNRLPEIVEKLLESGVSCTIGDVIDSIYQG